MPSEVYDALYSVLEYVKETTNEDLGAPEGESTLDYVRTVEEWMSGFEIAHYKL